VFSENLTQIGFCRVADQGQLFFRAHCLTENRTTSEALPHLKSNYLGPQLKGVRPMMKTMSLQARKELLKEIVLKLVEIEK